MAANSKIITDKFGFLDKTVTTETGKQDLEALKKTRVEYTEQRKQYLELVKSGNKVEADHFLTATLQPKLEAYVQAAGKLIDYQSAQMDTLSAETLSLSTSLNLINLGLALLVTLVSVITAVIVVRVIVHSLGGEVSYASEIAHQIATGNLGIEVNTTQGDSTSLLASMKKMRDQLRNMVWCLRI